MSFSTSAFLFHLHYASIWAIILSSSRLLTMDKKGSFWKFTIAPWDYISKFIIFDFSGHCYCICILLWLCIVKIKAILKELKRIFLVSITWSPFRCMMMNPYFPPVCQEILWNRYFCLFRSFLTQMLPSYSPEVWKTLSQWMDN